MTEETKNIIIQYIEEMTRLTDLYSAATSEIINTDIDETLDEIEHVLSDRGYLAEFMPYEVDAI